MKLLVGRLAMHLQKKQSLSYGYVEIRNRKYEIGDVRTIGVGEYPFDVIQNSGAISCNFKTFFLSFFLSLYSIFKAFTNYPMIT